MHIASMSTALVALTLLVAAPAPAGAQGLGLNLSWDDCGVAGAPYRQSLCDANAGIVGSIHASFVIPPGFGLLTEVTGAEGTVDVYSSDGTLPAWWQMVRSGACRPTGLDVAFNTPCGAANDYFGGVTGGVFGGFGYDWTPGSPVPVPGNALLRTVHAIDYDHRGPIGAGEWYAFTIRLRGERTVGTDACGGCQTPMALYFRRLVITQPPGLGDWVITEPAERSWVGWQCPVYTSAPFGFYFDCVTGARNRTWGQVKALYR